MPYAWRGRDARIDEHAGARLAFPRWLAPSWLEVGGSTWLRLRRQVWTPATAVCALRSGHVPIRGLRWHFGASEPPASPYSQRCSAPSLRDRTPDQSLRLITTDSSHPAMNPITSVERYDGIRLCSATRSNFSLLAVRHSWRWQSNPYLGANSKSSGYESSSKSSGYDSNPRSGYDEVVRNGLNSRPPTSHRYCNRRPG